MKSKISKKLKLSFAVLVLTLGCKLEPPKQEDFLNETVTYKIDLDRVMTISDLNKRLSLN